MTQMTKNISGGSTVEIKPLPAKTVLNLFARFHARYGHKWQSQFPDENILKLAAKEWADGLSGITTEQLRDGLNRWDGDWPPSLPEFRRACFNFTFPTCDEEWQRLGESIGIFAGAGESWKGYIGRIKRSLNDPRQYANPRLQQIARAIGHEPGMIDYRDN